MFRAEVFGVTSNHPGDSALLHPRFGALQLLGFPQTKITFERKEISDRRWDSGKYDGAADNNWENCVRSQGAYFEGDWGIIVLSTVFLVSCIFFNKCLYFLYYIAEYLLDRPYIYIWLFLWRTLTNTDDNHQSPSADIPVPMGQNHWATELRAKILSLGKMHEVQ